MHDIKIDPEFQAILPPLTSEETAALEESLVREGCRDALIVWGETLVDGHNRYEICQRRGITFTTRQMEFDSREDVIIWICSNQNARRNITDEQKRYLLGKRYEAEKKKRGGDRKSKPQSGDLIGENHEPTVKRIAAETGNSKNTVDRAGQYARAVDALAADSPTIKPKILSGEIKQPYKAIVEIAAKSEEERKEIVRKLENNEPIVPPKVEKTAKPEEPAQPETQPVEPPRKTHSNNAEAREIRKNIADAVNVLYGNEERPSCAFDDVLDEIKHGAEHFVCLIENAQTYHADMFAESENCTRYNALIERITETIKNLRRI